MRHLIEEYVQTMSTGDVEKQRIAAGARQLAAEMRAILSFLGAHSDLLHDEERLLRVCRWLVERSMAPTAVNLRDALSATEKR